MPQKINRKAKNAKRKDRATEILCHFICSSCRMWWSIGGAPMRRKKWFCPWCGLKQKI